jgi:lipopolysaccharide transport system ATP-binding protein
MKHSDGEVLVRVEGLSKKFCRNLKRSLIYGGSDIMKGFLGMEKSSELRNEEFWAIDNVNFELRRGECLGLIGHNGAGKSTLLKMLNGLIRPDKGRIEMNGKVGALIELGAGFSPFLTGRENVYNNGAVLGFSKAEIDKKFDEIVEFAELKDFIDTPVQNYSSGMKVRLGFAVAAQMEPDILLVDEVLAVGDMGFVMKCFNRMDKLLQNTAMIFVSHAMPQVARMSTSLLMLEKGKQIIYSDNITDGLAEYYNRFNSEIGDYSGTGEAELLSVHVESKGKTFQSSELIEVEYGSDLTLSLQIDFKRSVANPDLYLVFYDKEQRGFAEIFNFRNQVQLDSAEGIKTFTARIPELFFTQGKYSVTIALKEKGPSTQVLFRYQSAVYFNVKGGFHGWVPVQINPTWSLKN